MRTNRSAALTLLLAPALAHAEGDGGPFISGGATIAAGVHDDGTGLVLGGEFSAGYIYFKDQLDADGRATWGFTPYWVGGYVDAVRDFKTDTTRISLGPEFGAHLFGLDGGLLLEQGDQTRTGVTVRAALTLAAVAVYGRYGRYFDDQPERDFIEIGLLLKLPHAIDRKQK
jgi:hypothetical protein